MAHMRNDVLVIFFNIVYIIIKHNNILELLRFYLLLALTFVSSLAKPNEDENKENGTY